MKKLLLIVAMCFCIAAATDEGPPLVPQFNLENQTMEVVIHVYDNHEQVTEAKRKARPADPREDLLGWSQWSAGKRQHCDVYVARADAYMDEEFRTWGHELAHCLYGNFHLALDNAK